MIKEKKKKKNGKHTSREASTWRAYKYGRLLEQLTKLVTLQQTQMATMQSTAVTNPQLVQRTTQHFAMTEGAIHPNPIDVKMDGTNYTYWCQALEMHVKGRERMGHLTGDPTPPLATYPEFRKWEVHDVIVKGWLINSLELRLRRKYIRHPTTRDVWKALATIYYDGSDETHIFVLNRKVTRLKQEEKIVEEFYDELQTLLEEIDFRCPNPIDTPGDIEKFNLFIQKIRVYIFFDGLEDRFDTIRAQVLQIKPFPSIEQAYDYVRDKASPQGGASAMQESLAMMSRSCKPNEG